MSTLISKLSELKSLILSEPTNERILDFFSGKEWFDLSREFLSSEKQQKEAIISILDELTSNRKGAELFGIEVFIPTLWDSLVIRCECMEVQGKVFRILSRITIDNPCVDYGNSLSKILLQSVEYLCSDSLDVGANLSLIDALLTHAASNSIDIRHSVWRLLDLCANKCTKPDDNIWKFILLSAKLLSVLPTRPHECHLPDSLQRLTDFTIKCLQTNNLLSHSACSYSLFNFLLAVTRLHACSLNWLRPLCLLSPKRGEPFAVLLTSVIVELRLRLPHCDHRISYDKPCENSERRRSWFDSVLPDPSDLNKIIVDRAAKLLIFALPEMDQNGFEDGRVDAKNELLAEYLEDEAIEKFWLQLYELGRVLSLSLSTKGPELTQTLMSGATLNTMVIRLEEQLSEPTLLLLAAYVKWLLLYYETNRIGILSEHSAEDQTLLISELRMRLVDEALAPVTPVLWPVMCAYFAESDCCPYSGQLSEIVLPFALLLHSFPDLPVFSPQFSWKFESFVQRLFRWILSNWDSHVDRHTLNDLALLRGTLIAANSVVRQIHHADQNLRDNFSNLEEFHACKIFLRNVCKNLATSAEHRVTAELLPVHTEVIILAIRIVVQDQVSDHLVADEFVDLAQLYLFLLDDDSVKPAPFSLRLRLSEAISLVTSGTLVKCRP